jgi:hypothetical protein
MHRIACRRQHNIKKLRINRTCHSLRLSEGLEQFLPRFIRDPDAGVLYSDSQDLVTEELVGLEIKL